MLLRRCDFCDTDRAEREVREQGRQCRKVGVFDDQRLRASAVETEDCPFPKPTTMTTNLRARITSPRIPRPVRFDWLARVAASGGTSKCLHLGLVLCWLAALANAPGVRLGRRVLARYAISRDAAYDALRKLEADRLLVVWRLPGRCHHVILLDIDGSPLDVTVSAASRGR